MSEQHFDIAIIGSGPGGARAALRAAEAGMKTVLMELGFAGGTCLNSGCIPTKFLLGGTAALPLFAAQKKYTVASGELQIDLAALQGRKDRFIKGTRGSLEKQFTEKGITFLHGKASFTGPQSLAVKGAEGETAITFTRAAVATGSVPASFPGIAPDGQSVKSSASILNVKEAPKSMIIVGGGVIGVELGELFSRLGTKITVVEGLDRLLPGEDHEVGEAAQRHFSSAGWEIHTGKRVASVRTENSQSQLVFESGEELFAEVSMIAVGRRPGTAGLNAEAAKLTVRPNGWLETDPYLRCSEHVYAIGDVNGRTLLAHAADHQARYVIEHAAGKTAEPYTPPAMTSCIYGTMEVMRVGPTAAELEKSGKAVTVTKAMLAGNVIPQSYGHPQGFAKMVWVDDILCGVTAFGHGASHLASAAALLVASNVKKNMSLPIIFPHPTLDEVLESAILER